MKNLSFKQRVDIRSIAALVGVFGFIPIIGGLIAGSVLSCLFGILMIAICSIIEKAVWKCNKCGASLPIGTDGLTPTQCEKCGYIPSKEGPD